MKLMRLPFAAFICGILFVFPVNVSAGMPDSERKHSFFDDKPIEVSTDFAVYSKYMWRGFKLDNDPVAQSGVYIDAYGFNAGIWGSLDIDGRDGSESNEVDYTICYTYNLIDKFHVPASISGGYIYYNFPSSRTNSQEFYAGLSLDTILSPVFTWYRDFEKEAKGGGKGDYMVLEIGHSFPIADMPLSLDLGGHVGYNRKLFIAGKGGDVELNAGLTINLSENCALLPKAGYVMPFGDLKKSGDGNQDDEFYGGAALAFSF